MRRSGVRFSSQAPGGAGQRVAEKCSGYRWLCHRPRPRLRRRRPGVGSCSDIGAPPDSLVGTATTVARERVRWPCARCRISPLSTAPGRAHARPTGPRVLSCCKSFVYCHTLSRSPSSEEAQVSRRRRVRHDLPQPAGQAPGWPEPEGMAASSGGWPSPSSPSTSSAGGCCRRRPATTTTSPRPDSWASGPASSPTPSGCATPSTPTTSPPSTTPPGSWSNDGKRPLSVGYFFSLGHSTIVFLLAVFLNFGIRALDSQVANDSLRSAPGHQRDRHLGVRWVPLSDRHPQPGRARSASPGCTSR